MDLYDKLTILADAAKYDVACTSSGMDREGGPGGIGSAVACGICHSFAADGRCISLLKVLQSNACVYDCKYCVNRRSNDTPRATFTPRELAELTIHFYRRNYIEGLFLSSGVVKNADYTCELMIQTLELLREEYRFRGYIHAKAIPGADEQLISRLGHLADRMSVNIELPSQDSLQLLAPDKSKTSILQPMRQIRNGIQENSTDLVRYQHAKKFAPAGQSTQMIVGATPDSDFQILNLTQALYRKYSLKRVFFSAYTPIVSDSLLPSLAVKPPLLREHRLYQADWLLRFYGFDAAELLDEAHPDFNPVLDPKCNWAVNHMELFPVEVNTAPYEMLLRIPGVGVKSAQRIRTARRVSTLDFAGLKKIGVVLKRAQYFLTCNGKLAEGLKITSSGVLQALVSDRCRAMLLEAHTSGKALGWGGADGEVASCNGDALPLPSERAESADGKQLSEDKTATGGLPFSEAVPPAGKLQAVRQKQSDWLAGSSGGNSTSGTSMGRELSVLSEGLSRLGAEPSDMEQLSLFSSALLVPTKEDFRQCLTGQM